LRISVDVIVNCPSQPRINDVEEGLFRVEIEDTIALNELDSNPNVAWKKGLNELLADLLVDTKSD